MFVLLVFIVMLIAAVIWVPVDAPLLCGPTTIAIITQVIRDAPHRSRTRTFTWLNHRDLRAPLFGPILLGHVGM